ncbi:MAG: hypothetical protein WA705_16820 [Candidatus Ozemobacteraceae bacterium]
MALAEPIQASRETGFSAETFTQPVAATLNRPAEDRTSRYCLASSNRPILGLFCVNRLYEA